MQTKKNAKITAQKILKKYKRMKIPKKSYLIDEKDVETIDYNEPQEDLFESKSIVKAANKVLDYEAFKRDQEKSSKNSSKKSKKSAQITAKIISQKYKNLFMGESILAAANKVLDFDDFKKQQAKAINNYNQNLLENAETIIYVDDINLDDVKDNKDLKITSKNISKKY